MRRRLPQPFSAHAGRARRLSLPDDDRLTGRHVRGPEQSELSEFGSGNAVDKRKALGESEPEPHDNPSLDLAFECERVHHHA